jgi:transcriptional regulator with XRE-family HTH domain
MIHNGVIKGRKRMDPSIWDEPEMHRALARRDITAVYRLLNGRGYLQGHIAKLTGQSQSEVSEIVKGRQVLSYAVLERIANRLGIPRGHMGLAYADADGNLAAYPGDRDDDPIGREVDDEMISRRFLGMASAALLGSVVVGEAGGFKLLAGPPGALGKSDVAWIRSMTDRIWSLDLEHGGGAAWGAARGTAAQVVGALRNTPATTASYRDLQVSTSRLCWTAAWSAFDSGNPRHFWQLHATALDLAREAGDTQTVTSVISAAGRAEILSGNHNAAAKLFDLVSLRRKPDAVAWGLLGSAYAPHSPESARGALERLKDSEGADSLDAWGMTGHVNLDIGEYAKAVDAFQRVIPNRSGRLAVQETAPLAIAHLEAGEKEVGLRHAERALRLSEDVRSKQGTDALGRLSKVLIKQDDSTAQDLARRMTAVLA